MSTNVRAKFVFVVVICVPFGVAAPAQHSSQKLIDRKSLALDFRLLQQSRHFYLRFIAQELPRKIEVPREWLVPAKEQADEESDAFVSSFHYNPQVQSFLIGDGRIGLHLSSYEIQSGGSAQASAGRDIFLLFNPESLELTQGGLRRGVTKARVRDRGCFAAKSERYLIADIDGDGSADIGVVSEELRCIEKSDGWLVGPFYQDSPVVWYVLRASGWTPEPKFNGQMPIHYVELPLIGMACSPVDAAGCENGCSPGCNRSKWPREIHSVNARGVTAHFAGMMPANNLPPESGVSALWFTFEGDPADYGFSSMTKEPGDTYLDFANWSFDIFSPDGAYVLLLQDTYGPYHIVRTDKLRDYLSNGRKPDFVVIKVSGANEPARVYSNGHWISARAVEFNVSCCGSSETITYTLPKQ